MRLKDADELLKAIANSGMIWETNECLDVIEILAVKKIIDDAPTVEAYPFEQVQELVKLNQQFAQEIENLKRPKGEWIPKGRWHIDPQCIEYTCSICGRRIMEEERLNVIERYPFCHCGADMRGENT